MKSTKFNPQATEIRFAIEIAKKDFLLVCEVESVKYLTTSPETLYSRIEKISGVAEVNYDGHLGTYLHVVLSVEDRASEAILQDIHSEYIKYLEEARKFLKKRKK